MAGSSSEDGRSLEGMSNGKQLSGEALAEWRSSEQVENGITSTSPPYWDTDEDEDCGPKPSELYGKYTWKIDKFSQINKRELRSNAFEVGGYKWYILIYPQGCDVCNHLSLFLCVANHDKLLPGWSHFAQFTIAVVNKDPKKSKYSDTLHRFWKKEHDWGWKKFMELSKVLDGFVEADTLIIKAQVQVIRERVDRPFRCLDCQYRRELVRVYLSNVEQICRRFVEERRGRLGKLIEDKVRWSSFCTFWLGIDQNGRRRMSREKSDAILKVAVKHFFIEKEVTSTLVMDSLYSGLKALQAQTMNKKSKGKAEEAPIPIVRVEKDTFILVDDVLLLLERAALEPLPPKDEKGPQNRTKDGGSGEDFSKDSIERDERRLTELGRRTIEIFVLVHIFSKIEVAYQEAVALKRQEELIREEEEAWMTGIEQRAKREKEKKSKKKQGKQKRNNRKVKDKGREEKQEKPIEDVSDPLQPDSDVNWDTDTSEAQPLTEAGSSGFTAVRNGGRKSPSMMDDSSSTCSTDSLPSVVMNRLQNLKTQKSPTRGKEKQGKTNKVDEAESTVSLQDRLKWLQHHTVKKEEVSLQKEACVKVEVDPKENTTSDPPAIARKLPSNSAESLVSSRTHASFKTGTAINGPGASITDKPVLRTIEKPPAQQVPLTQPVSRPLSAPLVPGPRPSASVASSVQAAPFLPRSVSAAGRLGPDVPQSYRNAMMGHSYSQPPAPMFLAQTSDLARPRLSYGGMGMEMEMGIPSSSSDKSGHGHGMVGDEFPHIDIINDLLEDEYSTSEVSNGGQHLSRQLTYPGPGGSGFESYGDYGGGQLQGYMNGGMMGNQWQMGGGFRSMDPDYSNLMMGVNGYTVYRPSPSNGQ